jgi:hypothetical protein
MSKETDLLALRNTVALFTLGQQPTDAQWNALPNVVKAALALLGTFATQTDTAILNVLALLLADHAGDGKNPVPSEWVPNATVPTFVSATTFQLLGDHRLIHPKGSRVRATVAGNPVVAAVDQVGFAAGVTTITLDAAVLAAGLTAVARGLVQQSVPKILPADLTPNAVLAIALAANAVLTRNILDANVTGPKIAPLAVDVSKIVVRATTPVSTFHAPDIWTKLSTGEATIATITVPANSRGGIAQIVATATSNSAAGILRLKQTAPFAATLGHWAIEQGQLAMVYAWLGGVAGAKTIILTFDGGISSGSNTKLDYMEFA